ncbi:MAG: arginase family protein [Myxococcaceae bacterium]|nr:arginase family protein [Myxococcaceae bacterium]
MTPQEELERLLRPAGGGVHLVSTGKAEQLALQQRLYGVTGEAQVRARFTAAIAALPTAKGFILAVPSDVGAGFRRGANLGPQAIRSALHDEAAFSARLQSLGVVDLGDVFVVPQLLEDDMLSPEQLSRTRRAVYGDAQAALPVSPLSIARRAVALALALNPTLKPFVLGGDHSVALPVVQALDAAAPKPWGIVQSDAHTDLLEERLGIRHCFATWSWHADRLLGGQGRLTQVGIRASGRDQAHWEASTGVRQFWAREVLEGPDAALAAVLAHVKATGVKGVYFSNDIDGTDAALAPATGTPEPSGLDAEWVVALIRRLGREVGLLGGDVVEVAPPLGPTPADAQRTVALAARYFRETLEAALGSP